LDACKLSKEEEICSKLRQELEDLQEEYYRKQMKLQVQSQNCVRKPSQTYAGKVDCQKQAVQPLEPMRKDIPRVHESDYDSDISDEIWTTFEQLDCAALEESRENFNNGEDVEVLEETCGTYQTANEIAVRDIHVQSLYKTQQQCSASLRTLDGSHNKVPVTTGVETAEFSTSSSHRKRPIHNGLVQNIPKSKKHSNHESNKSLCSYEKPKLPYLSIDSPCFVSRKLPGESIYKAPGFDANSSKM